MTVLPLPGPTKDDCPCGCGAFGVLRRKPWSDGLRHTKTCECLRYCARADHRPGARRRESRMATDLGGRRDTRSGALSGVDVFARFWTLEETADVSIVRTIQRWWLSKTIRAKRARLWARHGEAHALVLSWDGQPQLVVTTYEDFVSASTRGRV